MFNRRYFRGWYFKCCTKERTIAFIPAYHRSDGNETASLQIIMDDAVFHIPFDSLEYREKPLSVKLGNCTFSEKGIALNVRNNALSVYGTLRFRQPLPIKYDIMGPFSFVPFMQCRHSVYSMRHSVDGQLTVCGQPLDFRCGIGYIEGDRGRSFPKRYIWTQCCSGNVSLMLSVADIPLFGMQFTGIIGVVMLGGKEYRIATYLGAGVKEIGDHTVCVRQGKYRLTAKLLKKNAQPLAAPIGGRMNRTIYESASCKAYYHFSYDGDTVCEFTSDRASFEFEYG